MWNFRKMAVLAGTALFFTVATPLTVYAKAEFTTKDYQVEVTVNENQSYDVSETIQVDFSKEKHGIYRYIPWMGTLNAIVDGKRTEESYLAKIKDISVENEPFTLLDEDSSRVIQIGEEDTLLTGEHTYHISYRYAMLNDKNNGQDLFYYNVIPTGWETAIKQATITIHMPKEFEEKDVEVYAGVYGERKKDVVEYTVSGNDILISTLKKIKKGDGVTVCVKLPESYFTGVPFTGIYDYIAIILALLIGIGFLFIWYRYVKARKFVKTVEFYPPEGLTSAELGFIIDGKVDKRDVLSLIIYFASKGYLKIEDHKDGEPYLIKIRDLPSAVPGYQKTFFKALFQNADKKGRVALSNMPDSMYDKYTLTMEGISGQFQGDKSLFEERSVGIQTVLLGMLVVFVGGSAFLFALSELEIGNMILFLAAVIGYAVAYYVCRKFAIKTHRDGIGKKIGKVLVISAAVLFAFGSEALSMWMCITAIEPPYLLFFVVTVIGFFVISQPEQRTAYGADILGKVLGFRSFIMKAEKDRIERMAEENPQYFYDILPYAYALDVTNKWAKKFEKIKLNAPSWYTGEAFDDYTEMSTRYDFLNHLDHVSDSVEQQINLYAPASSGSSSDYGGDSSDGGCSDGGAGGGGGGAW